MTKNIKLLATGSCLALAVFGASPALAVGTTSGSTITNTVTVNFQVGGVSQTASTGSNAITVDRRVAIRVQETGTATTSPAMRCSVKPARLAALPSRSTET